MLFDVGRESGVIFAARQDGVRRWKILWLITFFVSFGPNAIYSLRHRGRSKMAAHCCTVQSRITAWARCVGWSYHNWYSKHAYIVSWLVPAGRTSRDEWARCVLHKDEFT